MDVLLRQILWVKLKIKSYKSGNIKLSSNLDIRRKLCVNGVQNTALAKNGT